MKNELMDNAPPAAIAFPQESGWMTGEVCLKWMKHFVKYVKSSQENKVFLLVDVQTKTLKFGLCKKKRSYFILLQATLHP